MTIVRWGKSISGVFVDVADVSLQSSNHQNAIQRTDHNNSAQSNEYFGHFQRKYVLLFPIPTVISHYHSYFPFPSVFTGLCMTENWHWWDFIFGSINPIPDLLVKSCKSGNLTMWTLKFLAAVPKTKSDDFFCSCCLANPRIFATGSKSKLILN